MFSRNKSKKNRRKKINSREKEEYSHQTFIKTRQTNTHQIVDNDLQVRLPVVHRADEIAKALKVLSRIASSDENQ